MPIEKLRERINDVYSRHDGGEVYLSSEKEKDLENIIKEFILEREKELKAIMKKVYQSAKEDHVCRFNDGKQNCDCYYSGMSEVIKAVESQSLLDIDEK